MRGKIVYLGLVPFLVDSLSMFHQIEVFIVDCCIDLDHILYHLLLRIFQNHCIFRKFRLLTICILVRMYQVHILCFPYPPLLYTMGTVNKFHMASVSKDLYIHLVHILYHLFLRIFRNHCIFGKFRLLTIVIWVHMCQARILCSPHPRLLYTMGTPNKFHLASVSKDLYIDLVHISYHSLVLFHTLGIFRTYPQ